MRLAWLLVLVCGCTATPVDRYRDAITVTVDCDDYDPGLYEVRARVSGPNGRQRDRFELLCE
jgi:hypothetical protein